METGWMYFLCMATAIFPILLAEPSIEIVIDDSDESTAIVRCNADNTSGIPEIRLQYELYRGDTPEITTLDVSLINGSGSLAAIIEVPQHGWIVCYVTDYKGTYREYMDLNTEVCPSENAIHVSQSGKTPRPHGTVLLTCYFRFEGNQLLSYMWMDDDKNAPIYKYTAADNADSVYNSGLSTDLVRNVSHKLTETTVNSTITMFVKSSHAFRCEVTLKNGNHDCAGVLSIEFQDPKITIDIKEDKGGGNLITCATNETIGEANMTLYNLNLNGRMLTTKRLHQSTRPPILYVKNTIPMDEVGMFICDVTDDLGKYRAKLNWRSDGKTSNTDVDDKAVTSTSYENVARSEASKNSGCPHSNMLNVKQNKPVHQPRGVVQLTCNMMVEFSELRSYSWMFAGNKSLIYSNTGFLGTINIISGSVTTSTSWESVTSVLSTKINGNDANTLQCSFVTRQNQSCSSVHTVVFQEEISTASNYTWAVIAFVVFVLLVMIGIAFYAYKRLRRYQSSRKTLQACTQPLIPMEDIGNYGKQGNIKGQWGRTYATKTNISGERFKLQHEDNLPIRGLKVCTGRWNNVNVCGGFEVRFDGDRILSTPNFNESVDDILPFSGDRYIAGIQLRDGHMIDQLTLFSGPSLEAHKFGYDKAGELQPFESHGYLIGIRGTFIEKRNDGQLSCGLAHVQFRWKSSGDIDVVEQNNFV